MNVVLPRMWKNLMNSLMCLMFMKVLDIPLSVRKHVDCWMWTADRKGKYTVRSGYGLLRRQSQVPQQQ